MTSIKQPDEKIVYTYDFSARLGDRVISSITSVSQAARAGGAPLTNDAESNDDTTVSVLWSGGDDDKTYATTVVVEDNEGELHEIDGEITVADLTFTLPTGITSTYLTAEEYVARFGIDETVRLTDFSGTETVGQALGNALADASAFADGYIGGLYSLPLTTVPPILTGIVADLARERLHGDHPTAEVTARADRARTALKDIAKGVLRLPLATGTLAEEAGGGTPMFSAPDRMFTDSTMSGLALG